MKKNILIIGGTSGIGYDISKKFASLKNNVTVIGRKTIHPKIPNVNYLLYNLANSIQLTASLRKLEKIKKINTIIYCIGGSLGLNNLNYDVYFKVWNLNVGIPIKINDYLIKKKLITKKSHIFLFSSMAASNLSGKPAYNMAKASLEAYAENLTKFLKKDKILVNCIKPSIVTATGNNWYKCKKENPKKFNYYIKKFNRNGLELNSGHIFDKINLLMNKKKQTTVVKYV